MFIFFYLFIYLYFFIIIFFAYKGKINLQNIPLNLEWIFVPNNFADIFNETAKRRVINEHKSSMK